MKKSDIEYFRVLVNSFLVLGLSFLDTYHPNSLDNIVHTAAKGQLNLRKTPRCSGAYAAFSLGGGGGGCTLSLSGS